MHAFASRAENFELIDIICGIPSCRAFSPEVTISDDMTGQFSFIQMNKSDDHLAQNFRRVSNTDQGVNNNMHFSVHKGVNFNFTDTEYVQKYMWTSSMAFKNKIGLTSVSLV